MSPIPIQDREDVVIYRDPSAYISHPTVAKLANGDYLVAYNETLPRRPHMHPPTDPRFVNLISRSNDRGKTWAAPRVAPGYEWTGVECPSITQIDNGDVLLVQWQFKWYPLETARKLHEKGGFQGVLCLRHPETREWRPLQSEADWDRTNLPWARGDAGCFVSISTDNGATWDESVRIDTSPHPRGYSPRPPTQLADGTLVLALGSHDRQQVSYVVHSTDRGRSWGPAVTATPIHAEKRWGEPSVTTTQDGKIIMHVRESSVTSLLHQTESTDGGKSWSTLRQLEIWGFPAHIIALKDGRLFTVYGIRRSPFGIRACLSDNGGKSWDYANELIIRDDMKNSNLGYPTAIEEEDGRIFVAYYGEDHDGVTYVMGSHIQLPA